MGFLGFLRREKREIVFGDAVAAAVAQLSQGDGSIPTGHTAAMEIAAGWWARGFASATVTSSNPGLARGLTADVLADIGRALCLRGEAVYLMDAADGLRFRKVTAWTITGGPERAEWEYLCTLAGPSGPTDHPSAVYAGFSPHVCRRSQSALAWARAP